MHLVALGTSSSSQESVQTQVGVSWYALAGLVALELISSSDLHTFGFPFRPWTEKRAIADGASIKRYMKETTEEFGIDRKIQYRHKLVSANWSTDQQGWSLQVDVSGQRQTFHCRFVHICTGYYNYNEALPADIPGIDRFQGTKVHPQFWPQDLDYSGKNIVVIGSGATAITLVPNLAQKAASVTMLQRSPSYIVAVPQDDAINRLARNWLPASWAHSFIRMKFFLMPWLFFKFCRAFPNAARKGIKKNAAKLLPKDYSMNPNFEPKYGPWDQRLCVSPQGDFYDAIREGKAEVLTGTIQEVTEKSIIMANSDKVLHPDIIITATGLKLSMAGEAKITVDNEPVKISEKFLWKGIMLQDVPNLAFSIGYTNASWTLGADATSQFVTRLLNILKRDGQTSAVARVDKGSGLGEEQVLNLNSTYIVKAVGALPKAGDKAPWLPRNMYLFDLWDAKRGKLTDLHFSRVAT